MKRPAVFSLSYWRAAVMLGLRLVVAAGLSSILYTSQMRPSWLDEQCRDLVIATSLCHIISCVKYMIRKDWQVTFAS